MKTLFIEARSSKEIKLPEALLKELPARIGLTATVQFLDNLDKIKKQLESAGKKVSLVKAARSVYDGQALGCIAVEKLGKLAKMDAILYIGDGSFHPAGIAIAFDNTKDVFAYNPLDNRFSRIKKDMVEKIQKQKKAQLTRFYASNNVGILFSTKPGQKSIQAESKELLQKKLEKRFPEKNFYCFISDNISFSEFNNFPFIDCWVNTACPMIVYEYYSESANAEKRISLINIDDIY